MKLCAAYLFTLICAAAAGAVEREPFRSQWAPSDTIANYDVVSPAITHEEGRGPYPNKLEIELLVADETIKLDLEMNNNLLSPDFRCTHYDEAGKEIITKGIENCYYQGKVEGHPDWIVTMSTCQGLQGTFGDVKNQDYYYHLEPLDCSNTSLGQPHAIYLDSEYQRPRKNGCGSGHSTQDLLHVQEGVNVTELRTRRQSDTTFYVELVIVNDVAQYNRYNRHLGNTVNRAINLANNADNLYRSLNVRVMLVDVITWTNGDRISTTRDAEVLLDRFVGYKRQITTNHDAAMLITGQDLSGSTIGIAFIGGLCGRIGVGVVQDTRSSVDYVGGILAHELGHLFAMGHDNRQSCSCNDRTSLCVMSSFSSFPPSTSWSSCSRNELNDGLFSRFYNLQRCLRNIPTDVVGNNPCETNNGGCAHICTDVAGSAQCSCRSGYRLATNGRSCNAINLCNTNNGGCAQICTATPGSRRCGCRSGFTLSSDGVSCAERLAVTIFVDYTHPDDFSGGPNEYRAASGPVTVTCTATGAGSGTISYRWSSTCRSCPFQTATSRVVARAAVLSGDTGTHTCVATRGGSTASASVRFNIVDAGVYVFRGSPRGNFPPNNGLVVSDNPAGNDYRFRIFCRSDAVSGNVGQLIGLDGATSLTSNGFFSVAKKPGEIAVQNTVGSQNALTASQQGVYTYRIPLQNGTIKQFNVGVYPSGFNTIPRVVSLTAESSLSLTTLKCTTTGSPATTVTWTRNERPLTIDGNTYRLTQTVTNRAAATYENVLTITEQHSSIVGATFACRVRNTLGSRISNDVQVPDINECVTNNGGCAQICTNTPGSRECSCRPGYRLGSNGRACQDIDECNTNNGGCTQICTNVQGSRECSCRSGFMFESDGVTCVERLTVSITVDYTRPAGFSGGPDEYLAASGPVTVTCTATGAGSGTISYQWSSTCRSCPFQTAALSSIRRTAVHSGDNGTHTCAATRGGRTASESITFLVVDAGIHILRGIPRGNLPLNNGLIMSDNPAGNGFRFRIVCRSDSMSNNVGQFIGLDGTTALSNNSFFAIARRLPGELSVENVVGLQNALTVNQDGIYTCQTQLQNGEIRNINFGVYHNGFNTPPFIVASSTTNGLMIAAGASSSSSNLTCTTSGSPPTTVTWMRNEQPMIIDGSTYQMTQTVTDRATSTYENVLTINQPLASIVHSNFTCTVTNFIGTDTSDTLHVTASGPLNECEANNGGCEQICIDTATSFQCSCRAGYTMDRNGRNCNDIDECNTSNGGCAQLCTNTPGSRQCSCRPGFTLVNNSVTCTEHLTVEIFVDYTRPDNFIAGPNEYLAASGPVIVTCTATGPGTGVLTYLWSSTCRSCLFQSASANSVKRAAVHSGDTGTHTCAVSRNGVTVRASIEFLVVDAGMHLFRGSPRGNLPNNGLAISDNPENGFRLRIFCRSDSMSQNVGEFIGLNGSALTSDSFFAIARSQPGEIAVENIIGSQSVLTASQQGVYTCRIPLQSGEMREINVGLYPNGFNMPPSVVALTSETSSSSSSLNCISTGSPATTVTWQKNGEPLTVDGNTYQMTQRVTDRAVSTYENLLIINQPLESIVGSTFTCTVTNVLGSDTATSQEITLPTTQPPATPVPNCGGILTGESGSFQSPDWPTSYPTNTVCEWTITAPNPNRAFRFTFDSEYGIGGQPPCTTDYVDILNGYEDDSPLLGRYCSTEVPAPLTSSIGQATVVFNAGAQHPASRSGFRITYQAVDKPQGSFDCGRFLPLGISFGPPAFPNPISTSSPNGNQCVWRFIGSPGSRVQLRILYFDIPESNSCSQNSLKIYNNIIPSPATLSQTLCGALSEYVFVSAGNSMSVVLDIGSRTGYRGFHAVFETA